MYASHGRTGVLRYPLDWSRLLPFLRWRDRVTRQNSRDDALSGLIGALIVLPQAVAVILNTTEVLLDDERLSDKQKTRIGRIERAARDMTSEGGGIGLSLVKRICDRYGWRVRLESGEVHGTTVTVNFS